jgi:hypothetical protein
MTGWDSIVSRSAWEELVQDYKRLITESKDGQPSDFDVAELLRTAMQETEGI